MGAFLRRAPPGEEGDQRGQQSSPEGREAVEQLHEVGILARVENMARHDSVQGAQLLLYGHQRIKRLEVVTPLCCQKHGIKQSIEDAAKQCERRYRCGTAIPLLQVLVLKTADPLCRATTCWSCAHDQHHFPRPVAWDNAHLEHVSTQRQSLVMRASRASSCCLDAGRSSALGDAAWSSTFFILSNGGLGHVLRLLITVFFRRNSTRGWPQHGEFRPGVQLRQHQDQRPVQHMDCFWMPSLGGRSIFRHNASMCHRNAHRSSSVTLRLIP